MCGLAGIFGRSASPDKRRSLLRTMLIAIQHRGPDDYGEFYDPAVGIGLQRLSIVDLASGAQPMLSADKRYVLVCNGEIYNHRELRNRFKGYSFRSECDVEVLLPLYQRYGADFLNDINGQFAMAIYDRHEESLFLARDQFGICPLYTSEVGGTLLFASEMKSLLAHPDVSRKVDLTGLDQVVTLPGTVGSRTMFASVQSIPPGNYLTSARGSTKCTEYWDLDYPVDGENGAPSDEKETASQIAEILARSVRYRLQADVPVGFFLSGGLDSSVIAAMIQQASPEIARHSFSATFEDPNLCERRFQRRMAEWVGSIHHEVEISDESMAAGLSKAVYHAESPLKELYNTASLELSAAARASGIAVVLNGEGSDELFAGYVGYKFDLQKRKRKGSRTLADALGDEIRENLWGDPHLQYDKDESELPSLREALYAPDLYEQFVSFDCSLKPLVNKERIRGRHPVHKRSYLDFKLRLAGHLISDHGDRMTMANSVEGRFPFLDPALVELMRHVPADQKLQGFEEKRLLKAGVGFLVPEEITKREKFGFRAPASSALLHQRLDWVNDLLSPETIHRQGYFNADTVSHLLKAPAGKARQDANAGDSHLFEEDILTLVLTFGLFKEHFNVPDL